MIENQNKLIKFVQELRNRRVLRVMVVYLGIGFATLEAADILIPLLGLPPIILKVIFAFLLLLFPIAMGLAWEFQITPEGIRRTPRSGEPQSADSHIFTGNPTVVVLMIIIIGLLLYPRVKEPSYTSEPASQELETIRSIAVLPLVNLMGSPDEEYFVEGMHEAIITNLNRLSALKVISRTSVMRYKDTDMLLPDIARELGVDALIEGSVLKAGNQIRITTQLIHGKSDEHLWAQDYESELIDVLSLQKTVAASVAKGVGVALSPGDEQFLSQTSKVNPEAYNLYLKGWYFRNLESDESLSKAMKFLDQAVSLDSNFALAYVALAHTYLLMQWHDWDVEFALGLMKPPLDKALELDPGLADAHAALAIYKEFAQGDFPGARASFMLALSLDPDNAYTRYEYGIFLTRTGFPDEGLLQFQQGLELNPLSAHLMGNIASVYRRTRQYGKAIKFYQAALDLYPDYHLAQQGQIEAIIDLLLLQGKVEAANMEARSAALSNEIIRTELALGNKERADSVYNSFGNNWEYKPDPEQQLFVDAWYYALLGDKNNVLDSMEKMPVKNHILWKHMEFLYHPVFDLVRGEPRFKAILKKMDFQEVYDQYGQRIL